MRPRASAPCGMPRVTRSTRGTSMARPSARHAYGCVHARRDRRRWGGALHLAVNPAVPQSHRRELQDQAVGPEAPSAGAGRRADRTRVCDLERAGVVGVEVDLEGAHVDARDFIRRSPMSEQQRTQERTARCARVAPRAADHESAVRCRDVRVDARRRRRVRGVPTRSITMWPLNIGASTALSSRTANRRPQGRFTTRMAAASQRDDHGQRRPPSPRATRAGCAATGRRAGRARGHVSRPPRCRPRSRAGRPRMVGWQTVRRIGVVRRRLAGVSEDLERLDAVADVEPDRPDGRVVAGADAARQVQVVEPEGLRPSRATWGDTSPMSQKVAPLSGPVTREADLVRELPEGETADGHGRSCPRQLVVRRLAVMGNDAGTQVPRPATTRSKDSGRARCRAERLPGAGSRGWRWGRPRRARGRARSACRARATRGSAVVSGSFNWSSIDRVRN